MIERNKLTIEVDETSSHSRTVYARVAFAGQPTSLSVTASSFNAGPWTPPAIVFPQVPMTREQMARLVLQGHALFEEYARRFESAPDGDKR